MRRNYRRLAVILAAVALAGCGEQTKPAAGDVVHTGGAPTRPAEARDQNGELTAPGREFLLWAERELTGRCMAKAGFRYTVARPAASELEPPAPNDYGSEDVAAARRDGYGLSKRPPETGPGTPPDPNGGYIASLPEDRQRAYSLAQFGSESTKVEAEVPGLGTVRLNRDGCTFKGREQVFGTDTKRWLRLSFLTRNLHSLVYQQVERDARYQVALGVWRGCLRGKGYDYERPGRATKAISKRYAAPGADLAEVRALEIRTAVADVECRRTSGLVSTAQRLDREHQARLQRDHAADLAAHRTVQLAAVDRAAAALA